MTDSQTALVPSPQPPVHKPRLWPLFTLILLCLSLTLLAAFYFWQHQAQLDLAVTQKLDNSDRNVEALLKRIDSALAKHSALAKQSGELSTKLKSLLEAQQKLEQQALFNSQKLALIGGSSRMDWLLSEAEYLLRISNQRLNIEQDAKGAEHILIAADNVLAEVDDPALLAIRVKLAEEILALQSTPRHDVDGIYAKLDALGRQLDTLPYLKNSPATSNKLLSEKQASPVNEDHDIDSATELAATIWSDLKQAVSIQRMDQPLAPLMTPEHEHYLRLNLKLMLEQAALATLDQHQQNYQLSLAKAESWLAQYFNHQDQQIASFQHALKELQRATLTSPPIDISQSLRLLKAHIERLYRNHSLNKLQTPAQDGLNPALEKKASASESTP